MLSGEQASLPSTAAALEIVRQHGDALGALQTNRTRRVENASVAILGVGVVQAVVWKDFQTLIPAVDGLIHAETLLATGMAAAALPFRDQRKRGRDRAARIIESQRRMSEELHEPLELFASGIQGHREITAIWHPEVLGIPSSATTLRHRFGKVIDALETNGGVHQILVNLDTFGQMDLDVPEPLDDNLTSVNRYVRRSRTGPVTGNLERDYDTVVGIRGDQLTKLREQIADHEELGNNSVVGYLLDTYNQLIRPEDTLSKELVLRYRAQGASARAPLSKHLRSKLEIDLQDTVMGGTRVGGRRTAHIWSQVQPATASVLQLDDKGNFQGVTSLIKAARISETVLHDEIERLMQNSPEQARRVITASLYVALENPSALNGVGTHSSFATASSKLPADYLPLQQRVYDRLAQRQWPFRRSERYHQGPNSVTRDLAPTRLTRAMIILAMGVNGSSLAAGIYGNEYHRVGKVGVADIRAQDQRDHRDASAIDDYAGLRYLAHRGDPEASTMMKAQDIGLPLYNWLDGVNSHILVSLGVSPSSEYTRQAELAASRERALMTDGTIATGNVSETSKDINVAQWLVTAHGNIDPSGYWMATAGDVFKDTGEGWTDNPNQVYIDAALLEPAQAAALPNVLQVSHNGTANGTEEFVLPVRQGTQIMGIQIIGKDGKELVPHLSYGPYNESVVSATDAAGNVQGDLASITYWLAPSDEHVVHAVRPLSVLPDVFYKDVSRINNLFREINHLDPQILKIHDPAELASYISNTFSYKTDPFTKEQAAELFPAVGNLKEKDYLPYLEKYLHYTFKNRSVNCNVAATLFGVVAYLNGFPQNFAVVGGYRNDGDAKGSDPHKLSYFEQHAYLVDDRGNIFDPTPPGNGTSGSAEHPETGQSDPAKAPDSPHAHAERALEVGGIVGGSLLFLLGSTLLYRRRDAIRRTIARRTYERLLERSRDDPHVLEAASELKTALYAPRGATASKVPTPTSIELALAGIPALSARQIGRILALQPAGGNPQTLEAAKQLGRLKRSELARSRGLDI